MGLLQALTGWLNSGEEPAPPPYNGEFSLAVDHQEPVEEVNSKKSFDSEQLSHLFGIKYEDAKGDLSVRRITLRTFDADDTGKVLYLKAYCHERRAMRTFKGDRVKSIFDAENGEILASGKNCADIIYQRFAATAPSKKVLTPGLKDHTKGIISVCRNEAYVLAGLAWCDGHFHEREKDVIRNYMLSRAQGIGDCQPDTSEVAAWVKKLHPDSEAFRKGVLGVSKKFRDSQDKDEDFRDAMKALVDADGIFHDEECRLLLDIEDMIMNAREEM